MKKQLEVKNVYHQIRGEVILDNITFDVMEGEIIGLFGPNGVGKSTLLRKIANHEQAIGQIAIGGIINDFTKFRTDVMLVTSDTEIPKFMSLAKYCKLLEVSFEIDYNFVNTYTQKLGLDANKRIGTLSKGNKELAQLIAVLATDCKLLLLDEPFSAIDIYKRDTILEMLIDSKLSGKTLIIATHLIDDITNVLDKLAYIHNSKLEFYLETDEILEQSESITIYLKDNFREE